MKVLGWSFAVLRKQQRAGNLINALLDYYYGDTEDEEEKIYCEKNRYQESEGKI